MARRYSRWEIDEFVEQNQLARASERAASSDWVLVEDELSAWLGPVLVKRRPASATKAA